MRFIVNRERCVGAGQCVLTDPRIFDQSDEDGMVLLLTELSEVEDSEAVQRAVSLCPSQALQLSEQ